MSALEKALEEIQKAQQHMEEVLRKDYPVGTSVAWWRGRYRQYGSVSMHGYNGRIQVENQKTGKFIWLYAGDIVR